MRWPRLRRTGQAEADEPYPLASFLRQLRKLDLAAAESVERLAERVGIGTSSEWEMARLILLQAATEADRSVERLAGATAASDAVRLSPAGRRGYQLAEATAALTGEALAVRQFVDRSTWELVRAPWAGVATLPEWGHSGVGSVAEVGDRIRAKLQDDPATSSIAKAVEPRVRTWARPFSNPVHDVRLLVTVSQPWMSLGDAYSFVDVFAHEVSRRNLENPAEPIDMPPGVMIDAAGSCRGAFHEEWPAIVRDRLRSFDASGARR